MNTPPMTLPVADMSLNDEDRRRTLWFADGTSLSAKIVKVEKDGILISSPEKSGFIMAAELCTADRVRYGFGTRKESEWAARMNANEAKQRSGGITPALSK